MLLDLDADFTPRAARTTVTTPAPSVQVVEDVEVTLMPSEGRAYLTKDPSAWAWSDLRDYVVHEIEARFGVWPRDSKKEFGIFTRFAKEHGADAGRIAKFAFETHNGIWAGAPISVNRFCKGSDPFFADPIKARLAGSTTAGW